ncbi:MAG: discoidin domain-containing protein [Phocaeicola sp.]
MGANEEGYAGMTNWSAVKGAGDEFKNNFTQGEADGDNWLPGEADVSIRPGWFYHAREDHQVHSLSHLIDIYYESVGRNANLLLNFPIDLNGKIHPLDSMRIMEWKAVLDADFKTNLLTQATVAASHTRGNEFASKNVLDGSWDSYWAAPDGAVLPELIFTFPTEQTVNRILLQEYIPLGQRVSKFTVEWLDKGTWKPIETTEEMTTIGYKRIIRFQNVHTTSVRVTFAEAKGPVCINQVEMFHAPALLVEPVIRRNAEGLVTLTAGSENSTLLYSIDHEVPKTPYTAPFLLDKKGTVRAIAVDTETQKESAVALRSFDLPATQITLTGVVAKDAKWVFDDNSTTAVAAAEGKNAFTLTLQSAQTICGLKYTPDASRWGGGYISRYQVWVDGKMVAEGEFSNIQNNPIEQVLTFPAVKGKVVTLKGTAIVQGKIARVSEISLLTQ